MTAGQKYIAFVSVAWASVLALWVLLRMTAGGVLSVPSPYWALVGGALVLSGLALFVWSARHLAAGVDRTPAGQATFVVQGPYCHVRHPLYVAAALALVGVSVVYGRWRLADIGAFLLTGLLGHAAVVRFEEAEMRRRVGPAYDLYCARVPRWLPRLSRADVADLTGTTRTLE
jgi:protein-S-isoprenylcysteine O-methyltransferase Ste14